jgi:N-acetylglucosamine-6-phosphate deacetylase
MTAVAMGDFTLRGRVFDGTRFLDDASVQVRDGTIVRLGGPDQAETTASELVDGWILPGLLDAHVHGGGGGDFTDADPGSPERIARHLASRGTTGFMASLISSPDSTIRTALDNLTRFVARSPLADCLLGVHFEGPFLSPAMRGAHRAEDLLEPALELAETYVGAVPRGRRCLFTVAPELPGALELIRGLLERGCLVALGHSRATFEQTVEAIAHGARHATHLFNAMTPLHHRLPGMAAAFLSRDDTTVELIPDGIHVHPAMLGLVHRLMGAGRILAVTDAMPAAGLPAGVHRCWGREVTVRDGCARLAGGTLAGSVIDLPAAIRTLVSAGLSLPDAVKAATEAPARWLGLWPGRGCLREGGRADIIVLSRDLSFVRSYVQGVPFEAGPGTESAQTGLTRE